MKKPFIIALVIAMLVSSGVAWGSAWGTYAGFPVAKLVLNGQAVTPSSPPIIINGRTYVPLRFVSEALGAQVGWDGSTYTVTINSQGSSQPQQPTGQKPPLTASGKGVTITLLSIQADSSGTTLRVKVTNNSSVDVDFPASLTQIVAGSTQFDEPSEWDLTFADALHPGVTKEGLLRFPALPSGTSLIKIYMKAWVGNALDSFNVTFTVQL